MIVVTNRGSRTLLASALKRAAYTDWDGQLQLWLFNADPSLSRELEDVAEYPIQDDVEVDPVTLVPEGWGDVSIIEEKAVLQYGPPSVKCTCPTAFTCFGHLIANVDQQVYWLERYETPIAIAAGGLLQVALTFAMWGACPPLPPGCS